MQLSLFFEEIAMANMNRASLIKLVQEVIKPYGCEANELGPDSVGVQGDARVFGPSIYVRFPVGMAHKEIARISTLVINRVPGITRVLQLVMENREEQNTREEKLE